MTLTPSLPYLLQVLRRVAVGSHVVGLHALPGARQPGGDATSHERRTAGAPDQLPVTSISHHDPVLASDP